MIAVDTSTWIAFLEGDGGEDVELLDRALQDRQVDRKSTRLNSSHLGISYAVFFLSHGGKTEIYTLSLHDALPIYTSTWIAFLEGDGGEDVELLDRALQDRQVLMAPVVLTEVLSDPKLSAEVSQTLSELPLIEVGPGYWQRAGELRAKVLAKRHKARLGDALIAQSCIDRGIPLLTRDRDFRAFAEAAGLDLPIGSAAD